MYCDKCGSKISEGEKFCSKCGKELNLTSEKNSSESERSNEAKHNRKLYLVLVVIVLIVIIMIQVSNKDGNMTAESALNNYVKACIEYDDEALFDCVPKDISKSILEKNHLTKKQFMKKLNMSDGPVEDYGFFEEVYLWDPDDYNFDIVIEIEREMGASYVQDLSELLSKYDGDIVSECVNARYTIENIDKELKKEKDSDLREFKEARIENRIRFLVRSEIEAYKYKGKWYSKQALHKLINVAEE